MCSYGLCTAVSILATTRARNLHTTSEYTHARVISKCKYAPYSRVVVTTRSMHNIYELVVLYERMHIARIVPIRRFVV